MTFRLSGNFLTSQNFSSLFFNKSRAKHATNFPNDLILPLKMPHLYEYELFKHLCI